MKIMIVGGGATGLSLANLMGQDNDVTLVEKDETIAKEIADKTQVLVVHSDGADITALRNANLAEMDALVAATDDKSNLMICQIAKAEAVPKIVSLVQEPKNEELFTKLGISHLVSVVGTNIVAIKRLLYQTGDARIIAQLGEGEVQIVELTIEEGSRLAGKKASIRNASIAAIYRAGELIIPKRTSTLEKGDLLLLVLKTKDLASVTKVVTGNK